MPRARTRVNIFRFAPITVSRDVRENWRFIQNSVTRYAYRLPIIFNVQLTERERVERCVRARDHTVDRSSRRNRRKTPPDPYSSSLLTLFRAVNINGHKRVSLWKRFSGQWEGERERERGIRGSLPVSCNWTDAAVPQLRARKTLMTYSRWRSFRVIIPQSQRASRRVYLCIFNFLGREWTGREMKA